MRRVKSMLLTVLCAGMILGAGYFVIVESGQKVLEKERVLEESVYEDTSSNIFYGKIEENIELFPWNYYPEEGEEKILGLHPKFGEMVLKGNEEDLEEELMEVQEWYLYQLIALGSDTTAEEVRKWYTENQKNIMSSMVIVENSQFGIFYFYQDNLNLDGKQYQVRIACNEWNIISFACMEYRNGQERDRDIWEQGKEKLVATLESTEEKMTKYVEYMLFLRYQGMVFVYDDRNGGYLNAYLEGLYWLEGILINKEYVPEQIMSIMEEWGFLYEDKTAADVSNDAKVGESVAENTQPSYSYQIVELKDMILLLMQGAQQTIGVYYDPIAQRFCGYNFFYEY